MVSLLAHTLALKEVLEKEAQTMLKLGVIKESTTLW